MFFFYTGNSSGGSSITRESPLSAVISGVVFDLDATIEASYAGTGQTWANLVPSPADGSAQSDYDFYRGTGSGSSTDDPTFTGTANDPAAYWAYDGGDFFTSVGGITTFINNCHRTDVTQPFTIGGVVTTGASGLVTLLSNISTAETNGLLAFANVGALVNSIWIRGATGGVNTNFGATAANTVFLIMISYNPATSTLRTFVNSATKTTATGITKNTSTANSAASNMLIGKPYTNSTTAINASGSRQKTAFMTNTFIDGAEAAAIIAQLNLRHGVTYA